MNRPTSDASLEDRPMREGGLARTPASGIKPAPGVRPPAGADRSEVRSVATSTAEQLAEFVLQSELVHPDRWKQAADKVGAKNLNLLLEELAAVPGAEDELRAISDLRERRLTRYQIEQLASGKPAALVLGPYLFRKRLGHGATAEVLQAYNRELDRLEALKVLRNGKRHGTLDLAALVRREARVLASLSHPNITTVFGAGDVNGMTYLAMEYVPGETVEARLERLACAGRRMPVGEAVRIALEAAQALAYAHSKRVVHRDVKPGNIMVTPDGGVKLLDLGIAGVFAGGGDVSFTKGGGNGISSLGGFGTPAYMAPEQWETGGGSAAADVYGLGATLYHMLVGALPFPQTDLMPLFAAKRKGVTSPAALRRDVPAALGEVVQVAMAGDPARRHASMEAFAAALEPFAEEKPTTRLSPATPPPPANIPWLGLAAVFVLCALALVVPPGRQSSAPPTTDAVVSRLPEGAKPQREVPAVAWIADGSRAWHAALLLSEIATDVVARGRERWASARDRLAVSVPATRGGAPGKAPPPDARRAVPQPGTAVVPVSRRHVDPVHAANAPEVPLPDVGRPPAMAQRDAQNAVRPTWRSAAAAVERTLVQSAERLGHVVADVDVSRLEGGMRWAATLVEASGAPARPTAAMQPTADRHDALEQQARHYERVEDWGAAADAWLAWGKAGGDPRRAAERSALSRNRLGYALHRKGDDRAAIDEYSRALAATPDSAVTYRNRGFSHLRLKDYAAAERDYTKAIELDGASAVGFRMRAAVRLRSPEKDWGAILADLREAVRLDPADAKSHYCLAYAYLHSPHGAGRDVAQAVAHAERACRATNFTEWEHLALLAAALAAHGDDHAAQERLQQAERLAPASAKATLKALADSYNRKSP